MGKEPGQKREPKSVENGCPLERSTNMSLRLRSLFVFFILFCNLGLFACSWPWPSATEDNTGLGKSEIARILKLYCCAPSERVIVREIQIALGKANKDHSPRVAAESIGFTCEEPPSQTCRYAGEMKYQVHGAPKENKDAQKVHIVSYSILLASYDKLDNIRFETKTTVVP